MKENILDQNFGILVGKTAKQVGISVTASSAISEYFLQVEDKEIKF